MGGGGAYAVLAGEVRELGIRVTNVEPGPYATGWLDATRHSAPLPDYDHVRDSAGTFDVGDPEATVPALLAVVDAEDPPLRVFFGRSFEAVRAQYLAQIAEWERWQDVALEAFGPVGPDDRCGPAPAPEPDSFATARIRRGRRIGVRIRSPSTARGPRS